MRGMERGRFLTGLAGGLLLGVSGLLLFAALSGTGDPPALLRQGLSHLSPLLEMVRSNLRGSAIPFAVVLLYYLYQLSRLRSLLTIPEPSTDRVARGEQLLDLCSNLFFGIGVIWTAIGMREALLFALGDPSDAAAQSAFAVLERLVDGGILLALSTTIVGGIGGYLMRTIKSVAFGRELAAVYIRSANAVANENLDVLHRIERHLDADASAERSEQAAP